MRLQFARSAPAQQACRHARPHLHGIGRQHLGLHFQLGGVTHFQQLLAQRDGHGAVQRALEHHAIHGRQHRYGLAHGGRCGFGSSARARLHRRLACGASLSPSRGLGIPFQQRCPGCSHLLLGRLRIGPGSRPVGAGGSGLHLGIFQRLLRNGIAVTQFSGTLQRAAGLIQRSPRGIHMMACRLVLLLGRGQLGPQLRAAARIQQTGRGRVDPGHRLAGLHGIARLQADALQGAGHRRGDRIPRLEPGLALLGELFFHRAVADLCHAGQLGGFAQCQPGQCTQHASDDQTGDDGFSGRQLHDAMFTKEVRLKMGASRCLPRRQGRIPACQGQRSRSPACPCPCPCPGRCPGSGAAEIPAPVESSSPEGNREAE